MGCLMPDAKIPTSGAGMRHRTATGMGGIARPVGGGIVWEHQHEAWESQGQVGMWGCRMGHETLVNSRGMPACHWESPAL